MKHTRKRILILLFITISALPLFFLTRRPPVGTEETAPEAVFTGEEASVVGEETAPGAVPAGEETSAVEEEAPAEVELLLLYEEELEYAKRFTLAHYEGGYSVFTIPGTDENRQYLIVPEGKEVPENLPPNTVILQQPVTKICFASGGLASLTGELGAADSIATVAIEKDGWLLEDIVSRMDSGRILYSGKFREPDFEMLLREGVQLEIDTTMLLNYPDIREKYDELKIPYFIEDSTNENHPLGRMEWIKLLGAVLGLEEEADEWFDGQVARIRALEEIPGSGKTAALFYIGEQGTVYVRNAEDYIASMLRIAGGEYIMEDTLPKEGGNSKVDFEDFYAQCKDADYLFWIVLSCPYATLEELKESNELFAEFRAVQEGNVYTSRRGFAQGTAQLADVILEMNQILNGMAAGDTDTFVKLK